MWDLRFHIPPMQCGRGLLYCTQRLAKKRAPLFDPTRSKSFASTYGLHVLTSSFDWFIGLSMSFVIGKNSDNNGFRQLYKHSLNRELPSRILNHEVIYLVVNNSGHKCIVVLWLSRDFHIVTSAKMEI